MNTELIRKTEEKLRKIIDYPEIMRSLVAPDVVMQVKESVLLIANDIERDYPYISGRLKEIRERLFPWVTTEYNTQGYRVNPTAFGQVIEWLFYFKNQNKHPDDDTWRLIHPRIQQASKQLYLNGHYTNAATDAFIEINERLKNIFKQLSPNTAIPDGAALMNTIFSANRPILKLCDLSNQTGEDKQKGLMMMASGAISALRNPKSHANSETVPPEEAMRRLMFASMLMYQIDEAVAYSNVAE